MIVLVALAGHTTVRSRSVARDRTLNPRVRKRSFVLSTPCTKKPRIPHMYAGRGGRGGRLYGFTRIHGGSPSHHSYDLQRDPRYKRFYHRNVFGEGDGFDDRDKIVVSKNAAGFSL